MEVFGSALEVECIGMMERPSRTLKVQPGRNNITSIGLIWIITKTKNKHMKSSMSKTTHRGMIIQLARFHLTIEKQKINI